MNAVLDLLDRARRWGSALRGIAVAPATHGDAGVGADEDAPAEAGYDAGAAAAPSTAGSNGYQRDIVVHHDKQSIITEQYRAIRTQIIARARIRRLQTHVLTSAIPEEGKTITVVNLGIAFAELRTQRTLLLEADLRRPRMAGLFRQPQAPGLAQLLRGELRDPEPALRPTVYENLHFLPAGGRVVPGSGDLLASPRMSELLASLKERYDHILIDTPSVIAVNDACGVGAMSDETLLVVRLHNTPAEVVERARQVLEAARCDVAGVVLTHMSAGPADLYR